MSWPPHCIRDTEGAAFHGALDIPPDALIVSKATTVEPDAYSGFDGTNLAETLRARGVRRVFVCGLATDYCVKATALDAINAGFETVLIEDACRAVDNPPGTGAAALEAMEQAGVVRMQSSDLV
jgi:nicotinamidase/pyrazinamidase